MLKNERFAKQKSPCTPVKTRHVGVFNLLRMVDMEN
jgi:hypothetical protein